MGAESSAGKVASFKAASTLSAYRVVRLTAANTVGYWDTLTANIIGVTLEDAKAAGSSVAVQLDGVARVTCLDASVNAVGLLVGPSTDNAGQIVLRAAADTSTATFTKTLGIAAETGATGASIRVLLNISNNVLVR
jgi:hypothetical protein